MLHPVNTLPDGNESPLPTTLVSLTSPPLFSVESVPNTRLLRTNDPSTPSEDTSTNDPPPTSSDEQLATIPEIDTDPVPATFTCIPPPSPLAEHPSNKESTIVALPPLRTLT
ncbi:hypothetical protein BLNAU_5204 [Blattamonas nauphoetae]|uniref:Uncharacterized protein n=1 Tax=Blattamonas nauphoetae TaxID=2049346 RepID=A0ABQ9Y7J5_9EUKA|nr:hypothetical protein BLNAU_5204 [Blattamonas nauphoetae]